MKHIKKAQKNFEAFEILKVENVKALQQTAGGCEEGDPNCEPPNT